MKLTDIELSTILSETAGHGTAWFAYGLLCPGDIVAELNDEPMYLSSNDRGGQVSDALGQSNNDYKKTRDPKRVLSALRKAGLVSVEDTGK